MLLRCGMQLLFFLKYCTGAKHWCQNRKFLQESDVAAVEPGLVGVWVNVVPENNRFSFLISLLQLELRKLDRVELFKDSHFRYEQARGEKKLRSQREDLSDMVAEVVCASRNEKKRKHKMPYMRDLSSIKFCKKPRRLQVTVTRIAGK